MPERKKPSTEAARAAAAAAHALARSRPSNALSSLPPRTRELVEWLQPFAGHGVVFDCRRVAAHFGVTAGTARRWRKLLEARGWLVHHDGDLCEVPLAILDAMLLDAPIRIHFDDEPGRS